MPYIKDADRNRLHKYEGWLMPETAGDMNYLFTVIAHNYWNRNGQNYQAFNDIIGALEGAKLELYRRKVAPYEDVKIKENGDID
jgi:hypothetical protein